MSARGAPQWHYHSAGCTQGRPGRTTQKTNTRNQALTIVARNIRTAFTPLVGVLVASCHGGSSMMTSNCTAAASFYWHKKRKIFPNVGEENQGARLRKEQRTAHSKFMTSALIGILQGGGSHLPCQTDKERGQRGREMSRIEKVTVGIKNSNLERPHPRPLRRRRRLHHRHYHHPSSS